MTMFNQAQVTACVMGASVCVMLCASQKCRQSIKIADPIASVSGDLLVRIFHRKLYTKVGVVCVTHPPAPML